MVGNGCEEPSAVSPDVAPVAALSRSNGLGESFDVDLVLDERRRLCDSVLRWVATECDASLIWSVKGRYWLSRKGRSAGAIR